MFSRYDFRVLHDSGLSALDTVVSGSVIIVDGKVKLSGCLEQLNFETSVNSDGVFNVFFEKQSVAIDLVFLHHEKILIAESETDGGELEQGFIDLHLNHPLHTYVLDENLKISNIRLPVEKVEIYDHSGTLCFEENFNGQIESETIISVSYCAKC